jgi:ferredoxin
MKITVHNTSGEVLTVFDAVAGKTLLSQIEARGVQIPNACQAGMCAACMCHIQKGEEYIVKDFRTEPAFPLGNDEVMTCI